MECQDSILKCWLRVFKGSAEILAPNFKQDFYLLATEHIKTLFLQGKIKSKWPSGTCTELKISLRFPSSAYEDAWN